jgi:hypothetical protein
MPEIFKLDQLPEDPEELKREKKQRRRDFLKKTGLGAGAAAALFGGGGALIKNAIDTQKPEVKKRQAEEKEDEELPPREVVEDPREYKSGETIHTPAGSLGIRGWKVAMGEMDRTSLEWRAIEGDINFVIKFRSPENERTWRVFMSDVRKEMNFPIDAMKVKGRYEEETMFYLTPDLRNPLIELEVLEYPGDKGSLIPQVFAKTEEERRQVGRKHKRQASKVTRYKVRLLGTKNPGADPKAIPRVFAEGKMPPAGLAKVAEIHRIIGEFGEAAPVYVFGEGLDDPYWRVAPMSEHYDSLHNRVTLHAREFLNPDVKGQAEQVACHEILHSKMRNSKLQGPQLEAYDKLREAFFALAKKVDQDRSSPTDDPAFAIFREFSYYPHKPDKKVLIAAGHPWDNSDELFASAVTVFRYYAKDFLIRFEKLKPDVRLVAANGTRGILAFLRSMDSNPEDLKKLIPDISAIEKTIEKK